MAGIIGRKQRLLILLSVLLVAGYLLTSLVSYGVSISAARQQIRSSELPLTSDNIYSEIQRDLLPPIIISSFMASDTFLRDWLLSGEQDTALIRKYLSEITEKYGTFTSFLVSEATRNYYYPGGILKKVSPDEERDRWYFRVREMTGEYELNFDPDMANRDVMTIFINQRVLDYDGNYLGAAGVGLSTDTVANLVAYYQEKYDRDIFFADADGTIIVQGTHQPGGASNLHEIEGLSGLADHILAGEPYVARYTTGGKVVHINTRFIPELSWYLVVQQTEASALGRINRMLMVNLLIGASIALVAVLVTTLSVNAYERTGKAQEERNVRQHDDLLAKNEALQEAMAAVRTLGGLLPICASCKKIRDDQGYWQQIESYIREHSEAEFSHGICPDCAQKLYPELLTELDRSEDSNGD